MKTLKMITMLILLLSSNAFAAYVQTPYPVLKGGTGTTTSTGSGNTVLSSGPTLVAPVLGTPASVTLTNGIGLPISTGVSGLGSGIATFLVTPSSANFAAAVTDETGSGLVVLATSPILVTPNLGTPSTLVGTNITGTAAGLSIGGNAATATSIANVTPIDGGNAAYSILAADKYVRTTTTLTVDRAYTLPVCNASNLGETHMVKNLPAQTKNIILTSAGSDNIDGNATFTLLPGDSANVVCGVFTSAGTWDLN